jgi:hypothetical protein
MSAGMYGAVAQALSNKTPINFAIDRIKRLQVIPDSRFSAKG